MTDPPRLAVVLVNWNTSDMLRECVTALYSNAPPIATEIVVVDNGSTDDSRAVVARLCRVAPPGISVRVLTTATPLGFAAACNRGIAATTAPYVLLLATDVLLPAHALPTLVALLEQRPLVAVCSPRLRAPDGSSMPSTFGRDPVPFYLAQQVAAPLVWRRPLHTWATSAALVTDWVAASCMLVRRAALVQVGGLDEGYPLFFEDIDLCRRLRQAGWFIIYDARVNVLDRGGQSQPNRAMRALYSRSLHRFYRKHYSPIASWWLALALPLFNLLGIVRPEQRRDRYAFHLTASSSAPTARTVPPNDHG